MIYSFKSCSYRAKKKIIIIKEVKKRASMLLGQREYKVIFPAFFSLAAVITTR